MFTTLLTFAHILIQNAIRNYKLKQISDGITAIFHKRNAISLHSQTITEFTEFSDKFPIENYEFHYGK